MDMVKELHYSDYRVTNRGGKGIIGIINSPRNGNIASTLIVTENDEILLIYRQRKHDEMCCKRNKNSW